VIFQYIKNRSPSDFSIYKELISGKNMIKESDIRDLNPWWKESSKILTDKKIREWEESEIKYDPRLRHVIKYDFEPSNTVVYTLRGPIDKLVKQL